MQQDDLFAKATSSEDLEDRKKAKKEFKKLAKRAGEQNQVDQRNEAMDSSRQQYMDNVQEIVKKEIEALNPVFKELLVVNPSKTACLKGPNYVMGAVAKLNLKHWEKKYKEELKPAKKVLVDLLKSKNKKRGNLKRKEWAQQV